MEKVAKIFLSYVREDKEQVESLYEKLRAIGFDPWMDKDLLPGNPWKFEIEQVIQNSHFFITCLSQNSVTKRGIFRWELNTALEILKEKFKEDNYLIPVRLDECEVPKELSRLQYVNLFENNGWEDLIRSIQEGLKYQNKRIISFLEDSYASAEEQKRKIRHNLEYEPKYFCGHDDLIENFEHKLMSMTQPIILEGTAGIGKSAFAKVLTHRFVQKDLFDMIVWIDMRKYHEIQFIDLNSILDKIIRTFDPNSGLTKEIDVNKKVETVIKEILSKCETLIVFDNFENLSKDHIEDRVLGFISRLSNLMGGQQNPLINIRLLRILITAQKCSPLMRLLNPITYEIKELAFADSKKIMDNIVTDLPVDQAIKNYYNQIYELSTGIPGLIKVIMGQTSRLSIKLIQEHCNRHSLPLKKSETEQIYDVLFNLSWHKILKKEQRQVLMFMTLFVEHVSLEAIKEILNVDFVQLQEWINDLFNLSLIEKDIKDDKVRYKLNTSTQRMSELKMIEDPDFATFASGKFISYYLELSKQSNSLKSEVLEMEIKNLIVAMKLAEQLEEWHLLVEYGDSINNSLWLAGLWQERVEANKIILRACRKTNNRILKAKLLVNDLGFTFLRFEDLNRAEEYVKVGFSIYQILRDKKGEALAIRHLGKVALLRGEYEHMKPEIHWRDYFEIAERLYNDSLKIRKRLVRSEIKEQIAIADLNLDFGRLCWLWGRKCESEGRKSGDKALIEEALRLYNKSIKVSQQGHKLFQRQKVLRGQAKALGNIGNAQKEIARYYKNEKQDDKSIASLKAARDSYEKSLLIAEEINKVDEIAHAKWGLAEIYELFAKPHKRDFYKRKALQLAEESNQLYSRMATPGDFEATKVLLERLHQN